MAQNAEHSRRSSSETSTTRDSSAATATAKSFDTRTPGPLLQ
jgi:hypothetical protein